MNKYKRKEYTRWKKTADKVQHSILADESAVLWYLENATKVYDQNIEYPVNEVMPLCENTSKTTTKLCQNNSNLLKKLAKQNMTVEDLVTMIDTTSMAEKIFQDLYWWNLDKDWESTLKVELKPYMLSILKAKYIDGIKLATYARRNGYAANYPHRVMTEIRKLIKEHMRKEGIND